MRSEIAHGAAWMILMRLADRSLGLISMLVLARLLMPADFGLIAMALSFIALIELAGAFSFEVVLIQRANPTRVHYDTAWTLNLGFALACALLMLALAPLAADFYNEPRLVTVMAVLAAGWALQGAENIGVVNFRRNMDFSREFTFMFGKRLAGFVVTLILAYVLRNYWALVIGQLAIRATGVLLSYLLEPYRPRLSVAARRELFSFSGWLMVSNVMAFGLARLSHFVIGRSLGAEPLGLYAVASEIARLPSTEVSAPINRAVFPGLARLSHDLAHLRQVFLDVVGFTITITLPASVGLALIAVPLVDVALGARWQEAGPILAVLAIAGAVELIAANNSIVYLALGNTRTLAVWTALKLAVLIGFAFALLPQFGVLGMALAELLASAVAVVITTIMTVRTTEMRFIQLLGVAWRPVMATIAMSAVVGGVLAAGANRSFGESWLLLLAGIGAGVVTYPAALATLWIASGRPAGAEQVVVGRIQALLARAAIRFAR